MQYSIVIRLAWAAVHEVMALDINVDSYGDVNVSLLESGIRPEMGDKLPPFAKTFPGCSCQWNEPGWKCSGIIAYPRSLQGQQCCCCSNDCEKSNQCEDAACLEIGYDQKKEFAAERKRIADLLKGADFLFPGNLPAVIVDLGKGQCTSAKILEKCKEKGLTPVCDHASYALQAGVGGKEPNKECWTNMLGYHWSQQNPGRFAMRKKGYKLPLEFDQKAPGLCFFVIAKSKTMTGNPTIFGLTTSAWSHVWTDKRSNIIRPLTEKNMGVHYGYRGPDIPKKQITVGDMDDGTSELGTWRTLCVKKKPCWSWATCGLKSGDYSKR
jgi:hypothetical protein